MLGATYTIRRAIVMDRAATLGASVIGVGLAHARDRGGPDPVLAGCRDTTPPSRARQARGQRWKGSGSWCTPPLVPRFGSTARRLGRRRSAASRRQRRRPLACAQREEERALQTSETTSGSSGSSGIAHSGECASGGGTDAVVGYIIERESGGNYWIQNPVQLRVASTRSSAPPGRATAGTTPP